MKTKDCNCEVLSETDASHVKKMTPFEIKKAEFADDLSRKGSAINQTRESWTAEQRKIKGDSARPI